jgi:lipoic acid synthetase
MESTKTDSQTRIDESPRPKRPDWLKAKIPSGETYAGLVGLMRKEKLHTVCEEARCPNLGECWNAGTATFMILGDICTRSCGFCAIKTGKPDNGLDWDEPRRVAEAAQKMGLRHAVVTSVNRDEREDGGSPIFAETVRLLHDRIPGIRVEVLIPDFKGNESALDVVLAANPEILNHNIETVPRLYRMARPQANYRQSLEVLDRAKKKGFTTKTGIMVGIGERTEEVIETMKDIRTVNCDIFTVGQYLQPTQEHLPVHRYVHPDEFKMYKEFGREIGFKHVESGPLVRSSYHAESQL